MRLKNVFPATLAILLLVITGAVFLTGCFPAGSSADIPLPTVTISPASASVPAGGPLQFSVKVVSATSTTISWFVNNILGGNSTVGTISTTGLYKAPASVPNPSTVTVKATSSEETNPSGSAIVMITPGTVSPLTVAPADSSTPVGTTVPFAVLIGGSNITAVLGSVNGVPGGNSTVGTISGTTYTAPTTAPNPATVVITFTNQANTNESGSTTLTVTASNSAPLFVNFGPNENTGNPNTTDYNGLFTTVSVCLPGTPQCQIIPFILVDTGSVGLRVLNSALTTVPATELETIRDSNGNQVQECVQFGNTSYVWGPALLADVSIGGELASSVPIQVIGDTTFNVPASDCLTLGPGPSLDTVAALGANGILGLGSSIQDCGLNCAGGQTFPAYPYYVCPNGVCKTVALPVGRQVSNPVAFFPKDNNGVEILLPAISSAGVPSLPYINADGTGLLPAGQLIFGVGTESNNALGSATLYALDDNGNFPNILFNNSSYPSEGYLDSGSNAFYIADPDALGIQDCADNQYYCPNSPLALSLTAYGANGTSGQVMLSIDGADSLFSGCSGCAAYSNLGGTSGAGLSTDYFDLGLPFLFRPQRVRGDCGYDHPQQCDRPQRLLCLLGVAKKVSARTNAAPAACRPALKLTEVPVGSRRCNIPPKVLSS